MGKGKLQKFKEMNTFKNVFQYPYTVAMKEPFDLRGHWHEEYFGNTGPITLELGCGRGEYTVGMARRYPERNFIGVDIKGARMYTGARAALQEGLSNVAFLRTNIEIIDRFFDSDEVDEIWLTFSDPQMKNVHKRLTSTDFMLRYRRFLCNGGHIHLKTDSNFLYTYTLAMVERNRLPLDVATTNLYAPSLEGAMERAEDATALQTYYESMWLERGLNIRYLCFRLPHEGTLCEPDIDIPTDIYRSYRRESRSPLKVSK